MIYLLRIVAIRIIATIGTIATIETIVAIVFDLAVERTHEPCVPTLFKFDIKLFVLHHCSTDSVEQRLHLRQVAVGE